MSGFNCCFLSEHSTFKECRFTTLTQQ
jgi:hypothetical protein